MKKEHQTPAKSFLKKHSLLIIVILLIAIVVLAAILYETGFRVAPNGVSLERVGMLSITDIPKGTSVYVDQQLSQTSTKDGSITVELVPGTHVVIVAAPNDYPWSQNVTVTSGEKTSVDPILVNESISGKTLTGTAAAEALAAIASTTLPTYEAPLEPAGACALVYVQNNQIIEDPATSTPGCTPPPYLCVGGKCAPTIIYSPLATIDAMFPFPGRSDAVVILLDHSLFAIGLDPQSPQFFAPIAHGHLPKAGMLANGTIVISDDGAVSSVSF